MYTERKALEEYISWIREERRRLGEEYWRAVERLKEIDREQTVISKGPVELVNELTNIIKGQNNIAEKLGSLIPDIPIDIVVKQFEESLGETATTIDKKEIIIEKEKDEHSKSVKKRTSGDMNTITRSVVSLLKEKGTPVKMKEIFSYLKESHNYEPVNPSGTMNYIMERERRIVRASRGYYQYV